jgi:lauroyl/myristoyl acyltransferase
MDFLPDLGPFPHQLEEDSPTWSFDHCAHHGLQGSVRGFGTIASAIVAGPSTDRSNHLLDGIQLDPAVLDQLQLLSPPLEVRLDGSSPPAKRKYQDVQSSIRPQLGNARMRAGWRQNPSFGNSPAKPVDDQRVRSDQGIRIHRDRSRQKRTVSKWFQSVRRHSLLDTVGLACSEGEDQRAGPWRPGSFQVLHWDEDLLIRPPMDNFDPQTRKGFRTLLLGLVPLSSPPNPLDHCHVILPFRPTATQRMARIFARLLARILPVPRNAEILRLARKVDPSLSNEFPRKLFKQALEQSALLLTGGWRNLDLRPLAELEGPWTQRDVPVLLLSMHHGNWEWLAGILYTLRGDAIGVARAAHHPLGQRLLRFVRHFHRTPVFYDREGFKAAIRNLEHGGLVAFLPDQRPPTRGEPGVWLGQQTLVSPLPRRWAKCHKLELWVGHLSPDSSTCYALELFRYPPEALEVWDQVLDFHFIPWVRQSPDLHFGFFHKRLVSRETI